MWSDERKVKDVKNGDIAAIGEFEVAIPAVEKPVKYLLRASFAGGAVKAENEWEVYAFPESSTRSTCSTRLKPLPCILCIPWFNPPGTTCHAISARDWSIFHSINR